MNSVMMTERGGWVYAPTISALRDVLAHMEREGVGLYEPLLISHLENALGTYIVSPLNREVTE